MDRTDYSALVIDIDGTLIGKDERVSPRVAEAVGKVARALPVSIASGREPSDVLGFARQLGLTAPQVSDNGATILEVSSGRSLWSAPLGLENSETVLSTLRDERIGFIASHPVGTVTNAEAIADRDLTRVSAMDLEEDVADGLVELFLSNRDLDVVKVTLPYNGMWAVDFTRAGVNKGSAVNRLARMLGVATGQIIAAGDWLNDLPMLQACGLRIAMGGAPDELKDIADYVAPSVDEDGLAVAIEEFVLPRL